MQILTPISAVCSLLVGVFGIVLILRQQLFNALTKLHDELLKPEMQDALRFMYSKTPEYLADVTDPEEISKVELILNFYDLIGMRVKKKVLPRSATLETEFFVLIMIWKQLGGFVERRRANRGFPGYKKNLQWLVEEAKNSSFSGSPSSGLKIEVWR